MTDAQHSPATAGPAAGSRDHRAFVGPVDAYDRVSALQFGLLTALGLREHHTLLDIGCGSLRGGRLFIPYLLPGRYYGIEPEAWLIEEGIRHELGDELVRMKRPVFSHDGEFTLTAFGRTFDFLVAHSIFSHASQRQIRRCLAEAKQVMKPTAIFAATFLVGPADYAGDAWVYPGCTRYTLRRMVRLAAEQGLVCRRVRWPHPTEQTWIVLTHPGVKRRLPALRHAGA